MNIAQPIGQLNPSNSLIFTQAKITTLDEFINKAVKTETVFDSKYEYDLDQDNCTDIFEYELPEVPSTTIGFNSTHEFSQEKKRYGLKGIQNTARKLIKESCYALARKLGLSRLGLLTLTIPGLPKPLLRRICCNWQYVIKIFKQKLAREQKQRNCPTALISVTEVQPKRFDLRGEFALHEHIILVNTPSAQEYNYYFTPQEYNALWLETLDFALKKFHSPESSSGNAKNCIDIEKLSSNPIKYLSKYISKSEDDCEKAIEQGYEDCLPKQWWHENAETIALRNEYTLKLDPETSRAIYDNLENLKESGMVLDYGDVEVEWNGKKIIVAVWVQVTRKCEIMIRSMNKSPPME